MKKYKDEWDELFDVKNEFFKYKEKKIRIWNKDWWKFNRWDDLGFNSINRLSFEKNRRWGWIVNGEDEYYIKYDEIINNKKICENKSGRILKWIRKNYLKVIFVGLMMRVLWRVSIWVYKMNN